MKPVCRIYIAFLAALVTHTVAAQDSRTVTEPIVPATCTVLTAQITSPSNSGAEDDTVRIQKALRDCPAGQAVRLSPAAQKGTAQVAFLAGPLLLKSGVTLLVDAGVTLYASTNPQAYDRGDHRCGLNDAKGRGCLPFITIDDADGSGIMGEGVIDGQGGHLIDGKTESWWQMARRAQRENSHQNVPRLIEINRSRNITLYGITLANSPNFHVTLNNVDGFTAWGVRIDTPADARNTDGIDPISSRNITIIHSYIRTGDDNVAIKAGKLGPAENISILHNHFYSGHGMSIGSETDGGVRKVLVEDLTMDGTTSGLRIKSDISRGGLVSDVRYRSVCLRDVRSPLDLDTHYDPKASGDKIPVFQGLYFEQVHSLTPGRIILRGFDPMHPLVARLNGVVIDGDPGFRVEHARLALGPGPVQPLPVGEALQLSGNAASGAGEDCVPRFAPFPTRKTAIAHRVRPQLTATQARDYAYAEVMKYTGTSGKDDPWDPLSDALATDAPLTPDYVVESGATAAGRGNQFASVQAAVSAAIAASEAAGRKKRVYILVRPGVYRELVYVPESAPPITLYGSDQDASRTRISANIDASLTGARYAELFGAQFAAAHPAITAIFNSVKERPVISTSNAAVVWVKAQGFQAKNITFENTYNKDTGDTTPEPGDAVKGPRVVHSQAVALLVEDADKVQFENVRLTGFQDTLFLKSTSPAKPARSFFRHAYIEGDLDFIFGEATGYFLESEIKTLGDRKTSYVTAASTHVASKYGLVFDRCRFTHDGSANALAGKFYLGRQWFRGQKCTPFGVIATPGYECRLGAVDAYDAPKGTVSRDALEAVGKVIILNSQIGAHIDKSHPWSDWNSAGTLRHRPAQTSSDDFWANLLAGKIDPVRDLGYTARKIPAEPFLAEFNNRDE
jgi:polygalacturonase